jgi:hypothetical protein
MTFGIAKEARSRVAILSPRERDAQPPQDIRSLKSTRLELEAAGWDCVQRTEFGNANYSDPRYSLVSYAAKPFHRCDVDRRDCIRRLARYAIAKPV